MDPQARTGHLHGSRLLLRPPNTIQEGRQNASESAPLGRTWLHPPSTEGYGFTSAQRNLRCEPGSSGGVYMNWREKLQEAVAEVTGAPTTATPSTIAPSAYKTGTPANATSGTIAPSAYTSKEFVVAVSSAGYGLRVDNKGFLGESQDLPIQKYLTAISELLDASEVHAKAAKANGVGQNEYAPLGGTGRSTEGAGCPMCGSPNQTWHD